MSETDAAEAKRRAEWLHKHKAHKDWVILSVSEISVIRAELEATERERDEARKQNAALRDIAERAIDMLEFNAHSNHGTIVQLRAELNQLKEGAK
jgi:hypothetical protein